ncbi:phosphate ABC transporter substrate-binding protein [Acidaminococcus provencensis]|uniref:phosphate ABC transporter substrate-binding protein n=1 Tax=Acidaminococcus provencensis TaxID=2058289 RepID=UPI0022E96A84|nr:phosphate ABC transporter substrate-binding protein [Acidaminococcus provencensis]
MNLKSKWKKLAVTAMALGIVIGAMGCGSSNNAATDSKPAAVKGNITGSGSSALLPLVKDAAETFKKKNPDVSISLNAGGSGMGLKQVSEGSVDMGNSDVPANTKLTKEQADKLEDHKICVMTVATIVNKDIAATVKSLTNQQLADIFTAKVTNWKEVGGPDEPITLVTRPKTSGTRALFAKYAINGAEEASNKSLETDNSGLLLQSVAQNKGAIGYVALPYLTKNDTVGTIAINNVAPTLENTYSGKYNVWGYEHVYTNKSPKAAVKAFIDYMLSADYGKRIEELGYGVSSKMQVKDTAHE